MCEEFVKKGYNVSMESEHGFIYKFVAVLFSPIAYLGWFLAAIMEKMFGFDFDKALPICWLVLLVLALASFVFYRLTRVEDCDDY